MLDVIIPVFRGRAETERCIESVLRSPQLMPREVVVIDDATPEPELADYLDDLARRSLVVLLRNDRNLGFVCSANRGMSLHPERDVVLLNSDTEVANDWLDRLYRCAYRHQDIGIVTPFSNNATICSYPSDGWQGGVPGTLGLSALDKLCSIANREHFVDIPTAVGFCMFIRRACIERIGLFDEVRFGRGYGEENDFSLRAAAAGWRSVLAGDVFVFHAGSVSFGEERTLLQTGAMKTLLDLHPRYLERLGEFNARDPVRPFRDALDLARMDTGREERRQVKWERAQASRHKAGRPTQLHLTHSWDGGTNRWISDFCKWDGARRNLVLRSISNWNVAGWRLELLDPSTCDAPLLTWDLKRPVCATDINHLEYQSIVDQIISLFDVQALLVSSLIGHSLDVFDLEVPTVVVLHDMYPFCPALFACFEAPCTDCGSDTLISCMRRNPHNAFWHNTSADYWVIFRLAYAQRLALEHVRLAAPSQSALRRWTALFPPILDRRCRIVPHGIGPETVASGAARPVAHRVPGERLRLVVPGRLLPHKGLGLFSQALPGLLAHTDILLLGCGQFGAPFENIPGIEIVHTFSQGDLARHVAAFGPHAALMMSVVPESFSYTLSEMFALGLPVLATNLGAFAERIVAGSTGLLFEPNPESLLDLVRSLAGHPEKLSAMQTQVEQSTVRNVADMVLDYHALLPLQEDDRDQPEKRGRQAVAVENWLLSAARERQALGAANRELQEQIDRHASRVSTLDAELSTSRARCAHLEQQLGQLVAERAAFYRSRSWRWSAPLRGLSTRVRPLTRVLASERSTPRAAAGNEDHSQQTTQNVAVGVSGSPIDRPGAGRALRERIGVPDASRVVFVPIALKDSAGSQPVTLLAQRVLASRNDIVFLLGAQSVVGKEAFLDIDSALLLATRRILVLPDSVDAAAALGGADVLVLDSAVSALPYQSLIESGMKLLVLVASHLPLPGADELASGVRRVSVDEMESVGGIFSDWFGDASRRMADSDEE
ncbi:MAG: glycosyltransferase [Sterolibacteriaceae bacterium]|nr:glycosyltransferase [Candidatus Methylophosphatis haderslevensis]